MDSGRARRRRQSAARRSRRRRRRRGELAALARRTRHGARAGDARGRRRVGRLARPARPRASSPSSSTARTSSRCALSAEDVELYYEGFSNDTIWPLYHDVIAAPRYRRVWWEAYVSGSTAASRRPRPRSPPRARPSGCRTTSCSSCRRCCARRGPISRSATSTTFPSRHTGSTRSCRGDARCSRDCSAPTSSASSGWRMPATSPAPCAASCATRRRRRASRCRTPTAPTRDALAKAFPISIDAASYIELAAAPGRAGPRRRDPREPRQPEAASCSASTGSTTPRASGTG